MLYNGVSPQTYTDDGANRLSLLNVNATGNTLAVAAPSFYPYVVPNPKGASFRGPSLVGSEVSMPFVTPGAVPKVLTYYNPLEGQPGLSGMTIFIYQL